MLHSVGYCGVEHSVLFNPHKRPRGRADSDSDSIGAITGTLLGAHVGTLGDTQPLLEKLRGAADVRAVADRYIAQLGQRP